MSTPSISQQKEVIDHQHKHLFWNYHKWFTQTEGLHAPHVKKPHTTSTNTYSLALSNSIKFDQISIRKNT